MYQTTYLNYSDHPTVRELPERERPVNRLKEAGPHALSKVELLACLLQSSDAIHQAEQLMATFKTLGRLVVASQSEITRIDGIGPAQAARLKAALEIGSRLMAEPPEEKYQIRAPSDAAHVLMSMLSNKPREQFVVLALDTRNQILHQEILYSGTLNSSVVRTAEVFAIALEHNAASIFVAHNHPSGDPSPSPEDVAITRRLVEAGKLLGVEVLDHLVIGQNRYISMRERSLGGFEEA
jgi:DNA repair protein RadC